jgi:hypothetical protein
VLGHIRFSSLDNYLGSVGGEDFALGSGEIVLRKLSDLVEEAGASGVVKEPRRQTFRASKESIAYDCRDPKFSLCSDLWERDRRHWICWMRELWLQLRRYSKIDRIPLVGFASRSNALRSQPNAGKLPAGLR